MIPRAVPVWMLAGICGNYKMSFLVGASPGLGVETPDLEGVAACLAHQPGERGAVVRARPGDDPRESGALVRGMHGSGSQSVHQTLVPLERRVFRRQNVGHGWSLPCFGF